MAAVAITDAGLLERLALPDDRFLEYFVGIAANFPPREWTPEAFARGLRYPFTRPGRSFLLREGESVLLDGLDDANRAEALERHLGPDRVALLAFGSNGAPKNLAIKLAHHPDPEDREVLGLAGDLHGLDVVAMAAVGIYGAMSATLAVSPGARVRAAVLLVTATQLTTLTWGEMTYSVGRLRGAPFVVEDGFDGLEIDAPLAYVSRWGAFAPDGDPAPLAAVPAAGRAWPEWTQRELVDRAATIVRGPEANAETLTRELFESPGTLAREALPALAEYAQPFEFEGWAPISADGTLPPP